MKVKIIIMITFLFLTVLTPIYAQTHGLYTMDVPYAFGAGYSLKTEKNWIQGTDGLYHTGFLTCDFRLYDNLKFSIIPQIGYFDIDHRHLICRHHFWGGANSIQRGHRGQKDLSIYTPRRQI